MYGSTTCCELNRRQKKKKKKIHVIILHPYPSLSLATKILCKMEEESYRINKYMGNSYLEAN